MTQPKGPLHGVKVVACSTAQAGTVPYMLMADLGAEVIKIEVPGKGDNSRTSSVFPGLPSTYFETNNRGVKSFTLNMKSPEGKAVFVELLKKSDILMENFGPGVLDRFGFSWEKVHEILPCSVVQHLKDAVPLLTLAKI